MIKPIHTCNSTSNATHYPFESKTLSKYIRSIMLAGISAGLIASSVATAAETENTDEDQKAGSEEVIEEYTVYGIRSSLRSAIDRKKLAGTATDSIVAEDIGDFPDKNVGEALQRVTGVQLGREFGEGTSVSIRGVEPQLVNVEVNGVSALGASDPEARAGTSVDFASMASELVKALDVIKGSEARLTEGGIGGTVQVITRKPNDFDAHYLQISVENQYNDLVEENNQKYNLTGVYKFTEDFGALLNVTFGDKNTAYHALRNTEWVRQADYDGSPEKTFIDPDYAAITNVADCPDAACEAQWYEFRARIPRTSIWARDEDRISGNGMLQWDITDNLSTHVGYTYNNRDFVQSDNNLQLEIPSEASITDVTVGANHNASSFVTTPSANTLIVNRAVYNGWELETSIFDAGFEYENGNLKVEGTLGYSEQTQDIDQIETRATARRVGGILVEFDEDGAPFYDLSTGINGDANDPVQTFDPNLPESYWYYARVQNKPIAQDSDETIVKLDATYSFENGFFTAARAGVRMSSEYQDHSLGDRRITRIIGTDYSGDTWTAEDQRQLIVNNANQLSGFMGNYDDAGVPLTDGWLGLEPLSFYNEFLAMNAGNITDAEMMYTQPGFFEVDRDTQAIYLQGDFETEVGGLPLWGNVGARYVRTQTDTTGDAVIQVQVDVDPNNPDAGVQLDPDHSLAASERRTLDNEYNEVLPSINLNLGLIPDELILYAGAAKVMAHPKAKDLNIAANCTIYLDSLSVGQGRANGCRAGNPRLEPYVANQWDVALNWYPNPDSLVSAAYFSKKLDSWVLDNGTQFDADFFGDGILYEVDQPLNGSGATTRGYELSASTFFTMLPSPFNKMGVNANYTHMDADDVGLFNELTGEELPFPSQSEDSYNVTWFYETDLLSLKLAYNYRDAYLLAPADRGGNPISVDDAGFLDAKIVFRPQGSLSNFKFFVDARNLTEEGNIYVNGPGRISEIRYSGREFAVGFSYTM